VRKTLEICRICASATHEIFKARILSKYVLLTTNVRSAASCKLKNLTGLKNRIENQLIGLIQERFLEAFILQKSRQLSCIFCLTKMQDISISQEDMVFLQGA